MEIKTKDERNEELERTYANARNRASEDMGDVLLIIDQLLGMHNDGSVFFATDSKRVRDFEAKLARLIAVANKAKRSVGHQRDVMTLCELEK